MTQPPLPDLSLYEGRTVHVRDQPYHRLSYGLYQWMLNVDRVDDALARLRLARSGRFGIYTFTPLDHGFRDGRSLRSWVEATLASANLHCPAGEIYLLCFPRLFGFVFNPISVFYVFDPSCRLAALIYEVNNTFGETHAYAAALTGPDNYQHEAPKRFFVSPFCGVSGTYRFIAPPPGVRLSLTIHRSGGGDPKFVATLKGRQKKLNDPNLFGLLLRMPFMTLGVVLGIHFQALRLWTKGLGLRSRVANTRGITPAHAVSGQPGSVCETHA